MIITNKTKRPLRVPLPGGKKLHLGPGQEGQVSPKAADHPAVQKLVEAGEVELSGGDRRPSGAGGTPQRGPASQGRIGTGGIRHVGDR